MLVYVEVYDYAEFQAFQMFLIMIAFKTKQMMNSSVFVLQNYLENMIPDFIQVFSLIQIFSNWQKETHHLFEVHNIEFNRCFQKYRPSYVE